MSAREIVIYTRSSYCSSCERAKALLKRKGVTFREVDIESDPGVRQELMTRTGQRTVPQIFIGERHVGGYDDLAALDRSGELDKLLAQLPR